ncbi:PREDICTED: muscle M-line assembly protein unc-89 [Lupinus angustifolius]|uniref:muscle M-line assembly protein unc-89 n=1 Tax=Lupinus angustifolius TaxID=3871 RepID=UPI00092F2852|nr:PREDICTED: muscle M-line assembly protein unc-89 [Lupinus angustifolius]
MASSAEEQEDKDLHQKLLEAANNLLHPPSSLNDLLHLLQEVDSCLGLVEQSPDESVQAAMAPLAVALIGDELLRHADIDVKVAVASCISEITRISAPDAPLDDDQMKEAFQLIVSSFENLHDMSSRSYRKRTGILETVSKVRSCVVMLDLECDDLILEMFQHFLKEIREHHPENVFSSMQNIMTVLLEESEDISLNLLSLFLDSIKKENEAVLPIAKKLVENVLESCATKLKPYIVQAVNTMSISLDDYSDVLSSICNDGSVNLEQSDVCATSEHVEDESKSVREPLEESAPVIKEDGKEAAPLQQDSSAAPPQQDNPVGDHSPKSVTSNGNPQAAEDDTLVDSKSLEKQENTDCTVQSKSINLSANEDPNNLDTEKGENSDQKQDPATKRVGRKLISSTKSAELPKGSYPANVKEVEKVIDSESHSKENEKKVPSSLHEDDFVEAEGLSENDKEIDAKISSPKAGDGESDMVSSPSPRGSLHGENSKKKLRQPKKKEVVAMDVPQKVYEETSDSEAKPTKRSVKKALGRTSDVKKNTVVNSVKKGNETASEPDAKKHPSKKTEDASKSGGRSDKKRHGRGKANSESGEEKSPVKDVDKELVSLSKSNTKSIKDEDSEELPKTNLKRKRTPGKGNESGTKKDGENLVGTRVKVWWPDDDMFYKGVIECFIPTKKMHQVTYDDGEIEILNLKNETWEIIAVGADSDGEEGADHPSPNVSADMPKKKKGKTSTADPKKGGNKDVSSTSGGATSSKSSGKSMKSSHRSKDGSKSDRKSKVSKIAAARDSDEVIIKTKNQTPKSGGSGKSIDAAARKKRSGKSKDIDKDDVSTPKLSSKTAAASSKAAKSSKSGGKSSANGNSKAKVKLLKDSVQDDDSEDSTEEAVEDTKSKKSSSSKASGGSEVKIGKKRARN